MAEASRKRAVNTQAWRIPWWAAPASGPMPRKLKIQKMLEISMVPTLKAAMETAPNREMNAVSARPPGNGDQGEQHGRSRGEKDVDGCFQDMTFNITISLLYGLHKSCQPSLSIEISCRDANSV